MKKTLISFTGSIIIYASLLALPPLATAATYYVSPTGSDSNNGSLSAPFRTISKCVGMYVSGGSDTCHIRAGTYPEAVSITRSGSSTTSRHTLTNYNGETVTIDGQKSRNPLRTNNVNNIAINGIHLANSSTFALESVGSNNITIANCEVSYPNDGGLVFRNGKNILVDSCNVHHTNDRGLSANHESVTFQNIDGFEIKNSQVWGGKEEGIDAKYGALNGRIHGNTVYSNNGPNIYVDSASNIDIFNNRVYTTTDSSKPNISIAIEYNWNPNKYTVSNVNIYNNVIRNGSRGVSFWVESGAESFAKFENIHIYHNVFYRHSSTAIRLNGYNTYLRNVTVKNNIFWKNATNVDNLTNSSVSYNFFDAKAVGSNATTSSTAGFVDENAYDFRLTSSSPAIGKGEGGVNPGLLSQDSSPSPTPTPTPKPGDLNNDGVVDIKDYNLVINNFANPYTIYDYNAVLTNYGK